MRRTNRIASLAFASGLALSPLALFSPAMAAGPIQDETFDVGTYEFPVPAGVDCMRFLVDGASGGDAEFFGEGGVGGRVTGWFETSPGDIIGVNVGGRGEDASIGGAGGSGGSISTVGGDGGTYPGAYDNEPTTVHNGGGGGAASAITTFAPLAMAGGGGGAGGGYTFQGFDVGGDGGDAGDNGGAGGGPQAGAGGTAGGSPSSIGQEPDDVAEPAEQGFRFVGGGGGSGGGNGGLGGVSSIVTNSESGAGGGGGGTNFFNAAVIGQSESNAPEGEGEVVLTWQVGNTGECGDGFDPVDDDEPGDDGDDTNAGSTFDTGVTPSDSNYAFPLTVLGAISAGTAGVLLLRSRRRTS